MRKIKNKKSFILNVLIPILLGSAFALAARDDFSYLESLKRSIEVPALVFPIIWSILYILMGIWAYFNEEEGENQLKLNIYWVALLVNLLFTPLLFTFHQLIWALIDVIVLIGMIGYLLISGLKQKLKYTYLLLPYMIWLMLALTLMIDLVVHN